MYLNCQHCGKKYSQPREYAITKHCQSDFSSNGFRKNITDLKKLEYLNVEKVDPIVLSKLITDNNQKIKTLAKTKLSKLDPTGLVKLYTQTDTNIFTSDDGKVDSNVLKIVKDEIIKKNAKDVGNGIVDFVYSLNNSGEVDKIFHSSYDFRDFVKNAVCSKRLSVSSLKKCVEMLDSSIEAINEFASEESCELAAQEVEEMDDNGEFDDEDEKEEYQDKLEDEYYDDLRADYGCEVSDFIKNANLNDKNMKEFYESKINFALEVEEDDIENLLRKDFSFKNLCWLKEQAEEVAKKDKSKNEAKKVVDFFIKESLSMIKNIEKKEKLKRRPDENFLSFITNEIENLQNIYKYFKTLI